MNTIVFFICIIFTAIGYSPSLTDQKTNINKSNHQVDSLVHQWREDSLGCKKNRNYKKAELIIDKYYLKNKTVFQITSLIGEPNKRLKHNKSGVILRYYFDTCCKNGKIDLRECDYSWVDFIFNNSGDKKCTIGAGVI